MHISMPYTGEGRDIALQCVDEVERFDSLLPESRPVRKPSRFSKAAMGLESCLTQDNNGPSDYDVVVGIRLRCESRSDAATIEGDLELVALYDTLAPDSFHLHAAVANSRGGVIGGHVLAGCSVWTTAELVIGT